VLCLGAALSALTVLLAVVIDVFLPASVRAQADIGISRWGLLPTAVSVACVVMGIRSLRRDPARGYAWFERALLVDLLLTQPIVVASDQFSALPTVALDLVMLGVIAAARAAAAAPPDTVDGVRPAAAPAGG